MQEDQERTRGEGAGGKVGREWRRVKLQAIPVLRVQEPRKGFFVSVALHPTYQPVYARLHTHVIRLSEVSEVIVRACPPVFATHSK